jgi:hypothetical protein
MNENDRLKLTQTNSKLHVFVTYDGPRYWTAWAKNWDDAEVDMPLLARPTPEEALRDGRTHYANRTVDEIWGTSS